MTRTELPDGCYSITDEWGTCYCNSNGQFHRDGGLPAIEWANGTKEYYINGQRHNVYGPAYAKPSGYCEYWLSGHQLSEAEWLAHPDVIAVTRPSTRAVLDTSHGFCFNCGEPIERVWTMSGPAGWYVHTDTRNESCEPAREMK